MGALACAGGPVQLFACVVRELYECTFGGTCFGGNGGNGGKVGQKRANFFSAPSVFTLLHQFLRFWRQIPVLATFLRLSISKDSRLSAGGWEGWRGVVFGP